MRRTVHIDGDILVYSVGFAAEKGLYTVEWQPEGSLDYSQQQFQYKADVDEFTKTLGRKPYVLTFERQPEPVENALHSLKLSIARIVEETEADDHVIYISGPTNFRSSLATVREYKGNRDKTHKPTHGPAIRQYMVEHHPTIVSDNEEADDVIGYTHYARHKQDPESSVIATQDKDLNMIPGYHYNFAKRDMFYVDDLDADFNFYKQLLSGDATDNVVGVPGLGSRKAEKLMEPGRGDVREMYKIARAQYRYNDKLLLENARLLWIRRNKGELWEPPTILESATPSV